VDAPPASSELSFDAGQGQETGPVQRHPPASSGIVVGDPYRANPNFGERVMKGAVRAAPGVIGAALGGELAGSAGVLGWLGRGLGMATGTAASDLMAGEKPTLERSAVAGGANMATEGAFNLGSRLLALPTSLEQSTVGRALQKPPLAAARTVFGAPGQMAERTQGLDLVNRLKGAQGTLSAGRLTKLEILRTAESTGVKVPLQKITGAIDAGLQDAGAAVGRANDVATSRLTYVKAQLAKKFPSGNMTPMQADAQLRAFQRDAEAASAQNNPFLARTYYGLKDSLREAFHDAVNSAAPGTDIAKATGQARSYLNAVDTLDSFVSGKTPETFVRSLFSQANQSKLQALRTFEEQTGTAGSLETRIRDLADKRAWTNSDQQKAFGIMRTLYNKLGKRVVGAGTVAARPAGAVAGASTAAFERAMGTGTKTSEPQSTEAP